MKISTVLIYATLLLYANVSFTHERNDLEYLRTLITKNLKNLVIHQDPIPILELKLLTINDKKEIIKFNHDSLTVINFWATWCIPCIEEMPSLNKLVKSIKSNNFSIIAIAAGRNSEEKIKEFFFKHELTNLNSYKDPKGKISSQMNILGLPTTIIVDQHSNELARLIGSTDWNSDEVITFIQKVLDHGKKAH